MKRRLLWLIPSLYLLSACSMSLFQEEQGTEELSKTQREAREKLTEGRSSRPSLAELNLAPARDDLPQAPQKNARAELEIPRLSLQQKRDEYQALLPLIDDPVLKEQVAFRLADIQMLLAEQALEQGSSEQANYLARAIDAYEQVIKQTELSVPMPGLVLDQNQEKNNIKLMDAQYQLSRALDLAGQREQSVASAKDFLRRFSLTHFAASEKHVELWFRLGEHYFSQQDFPQAIDYYRQVLTHGKANSKTDFFGISAYMLGWSYFKLDDYDNALIGFDTMVAHSVNKLADIDRLRVDELPIGKGNLRLFKDSLRVMALTFSYRGNEVAIADFYADTSDAPYLHLLYEELAQQHLDDDRYQDSAEVLLAFAQTYPSHDRSVEFFVRHIDAFILGQFPERVFAGKQAFVAQFGLGKGVLDSFNTPLGRQAAPYIQQYLPELAQTEHSIAQGIDRLLQARSQKLAASDFTQAFNSTQTSPEQLAAWRSIDDQDLLSLKAQALDNAIEHYAEFIHSFERQTDLMEQVAELRFYMAEAMFSAKRYEQAIVAFETYAYQDAINPMAVEAAYAAILAWRELPPVLAPEALYSEAQQSQVKFLDSFASDRRSPAIAVSLMQDLFKRQQYVVAMRWASWVLEEAISLHQFSAEQNESALLVMAHGHYALDEFAFAEQYYDRVLQVLAKDDQRTRELKEALAASIYKQAEAELLAQGLDQTTIQAIDLRDNRLSDMQRVAFERAIGHFSRLINKTPQASSRLVAEYDSASYQAYLGHWQAAIDGWQQFAARNPQHELSANIKPQLLFAYEQLQDWSAAAVLLLERYQNSPDTDQGRLSLFTAAEYFDKDKDRERALDSFRTYAHAYPEPMAQANEARFRLSEFYLDSGEDSKRRFWLNKLMQAQLALSSDKPANVGTPRSRYLAAMAAMVFAQDADLVFKRIKLSVPLDKSLRSKQVALEQAIAAYDRVMSFAVAEFTTEANYKLGGLYAALARDLMDSERPNGLSALEAEQYDILLEEQAYPFEETAIQLHEQNIARVQQGLYDEHVKQSFKALSQSMPARYNKPEVFAEVSVDEL